MQYNFDSAALILKLKKIGIDVSVVDDQLKLSLDHSVNSAGGLQDIIQEIGQHKTELISFITAARNSFDFQHIGPALQKSHYALSSGQNRFYFLWEYDKQSLAYNMPQMLKVDGKLDLVHLEECFQKLLVRQENLRVVFEVIDGQVMQRIVPSMSLGIEYVESTEDGVDDVIKAFVRPFDLNNGPLIRIGIIVRECIDDASIPEEFILMVDMHHIITDGISQNILIRDFMALYCNEELPALRLHYKDFAEWQQHEEQKQRLGLPEKFWLNQYKDIPDALSLPMDFPRPLVKRFDGNSVSFQLGSGQSGSLRGLAAREGATTFMVVLSIFNILLSKLSGQEDIVIGTPIAGRYHADLERIMGFFVNTLALRNCPSGSLTFLEFLQKLKASTLSCFDNQSYPYEKLIEQLAVERDTSRNPLFDVMLVFQNQEEAELTIPGLSFQAINNKKATSKFDLLLSCVEGADFINFNLEYSTALFKHSTIEGFVKGFMLLVAQITENPGRKISELCVMDDAEVDRVLNVFNDTVKHYDDQKTIHVLFEEQAEKNTAQVALCHNGGFMTYGELNSRANQLALLLREKGVTRNMIVGVMHDRSFGMIVSLLAVLKAGAAYLPIDTSYPQDRIAYMISNSRLTVVLTDRPAGMPEDLYPGVSFINVAEIEFADMKIDNLCRVSTRGDLLYVIYTSGSTGQPKGVMLKNSNLTNLVNFYHHETSIDFSFVLQFTTLSFDVSFTEIFATLLKGGKLQLVDQSDLTNFRSLITLIQNNAIRTVFMPASIINQIFNVEDYLDILPTTLTHIVTAGEQILIGDIFRSYLKKNKIHLHNHYGPSETHVVTTHTLLPELAIPQRPVIGKPIQNTRIYILDKCLQPVPTNVTGELFLGGMQVGDGYLYNTGLTAERFVQNPFIPNDILYKSGDLGRWLPDGTIEFFGRIDDQVKIRGFRIELSEIENKLIDIAYINEAVVVVKERMGDKMLVAYFVSDRQVDGDDLRDILMQSLPDFMIPSYFVQVEKMPLTLSGKLNKRALPAPQVSSGRYVAPSTTMEEKMVAIWSEVLKIGKDEISVDSSFFRLGGHSLSAMVLVNRIQDELKVQIPIKEIFLHKDLSSLARLVNTQSV